MSRMDKKDKMQKEAEQEAREEALEEEALPVEDAADASQAPKGPTQEELDAAKAKADEYLTLAQRVQADFDNFRRRNESVRADAYNEGIRALAATLLPGAGRGRGEGFARCPIKGGRWAGASPAGRRVPEAGHHPH